jgi:hypothetical protein
MPSVALISKHKVQSRGWCHVELGGYVFDRRADRGHSGFWRDCRSIRRNRQDHLLHRGGAVSGLGRGRSGARADPDLAERANRYFEGIVCATLQCAERRQRRATLESRDCLRANADSLRKLSLRPTPGFRCATSLAPSRCASAGRALHRTAITVVHWINSYG